MTIAHCQNPIDDAGNLCGAAFKKRTNAHKYCSDCAIDRPRKRARDRYRNNPDSAILQCLKRRVTPLHHRRLSCKICSASFMPAQSNQKCCSLACSAENVRRLREASRRRGGRIPLSERRLACPVCKSQFIPISNTQKTCSAECGKSRKSRVTLYSKWKKSHGLSQKDFDNLFDQQDGKCALSREPLNKPVVDHDHKTNRVRGIIENRFNVGLGCFRDDPSLLLAGLVYLTKDAA